MNVEVVQNGIWYPVNVIKKANDGSLLVSFPSKCREDLYVKADQCRVVRSTKNDELLPGDTIEVFGVQNVNGWQKATLKHQKKDLFIVETVDSKQTDALERKAIRSSKTQYASFNSVDMHTTEINVPEDLDDYFSRRENVNDFISQIPGIYADYDKTKRILHISSIDSKLIHKAMILHELYFKDAKTKEALRMRKEEMSRKVQNSHHHSESDYVEEFSVPLDLMGLAIGTQGANIQNARKIEGVTEILVQEASNVPAVFKVYADTSEAAQKARELLEYGVDQIEVEQNFVGKIIGKTGKTIQDIVDKSGVIRVQIAGSDEDENPVPFIFTGTRTSIDLAKFLIEYNVRNIKEVEDLRGDVDELERQIFPRRFERTNGGGNYRGRGGSRGGRGGAFQGEFENGRDNESPEDNHRPNFGNGRRTRDEENDEDQDETPRTNGSFRGGRGNRRGRSHNGRGNRGH